MAFPAGLALAGSDRPLVLRQALRHALGRGCWRRVWPGRRPTDPGPRRDITMHTQGGHMVEVRRLPLNLNSRPRHRCGRPWAAYARHLSGWEIETTLDA